MKNTNIPKLQPKTDCICYKNGKCTGLKDLYCKYEDCKFYKSKHKTHKIK